MATHVLVAVDGSPQSWVALEHALSSYPGERLTTLTVVDPIDELYEDLTPGNEAAHRAHDRSLERATELGDRVRERAAEAGVADATALDHEVLVGRPARGIVTYAAAHDVDHVVVGSRGRTGLPRILLGSVAESVARRSPVPVTIVR